MNTNNDVMVNAKGIETEGTNEDDFREEFAEQIQPKEIENPTEETQGTETLKSEEISQLQKRTNDLFEVMSMCDDEMEKQLCRNEIIELNIRLVPHVLRKYKPFGDDEFQLGCLGLILATNSFDPARKVPFSNFACFCIERELHKAHRRNANTIEAVLGNELEYFDEVITFNNGDKGSRYDATPDVMSEQQINDILDEHSLTDLFDKVVLPSITEIGGKTKGQSAKIDFVKWKMLELRYIIEMSEVDSQKARITFTNMAKDLGVSVQNIRMRHQRVVEEIKEKCLDLGLYA